MSSLAFVNSLPVCSDNANFFAADARELYPCGQLIKGGIVNG
jgi:hypothetical protein